MMSETNLQRFKKREYVCMHVQKERVWKRAQVWQNVNVLCIQWKVYEYPLYHSLSFPVGLKIMQNKMLEKVN